MSLAARPARAVTFGYAVLGYALFLATLGYTAGFLIGAGVPKGISSETQSSPPVALAIDLALLGLFAAQHSVMARPWFKRVITRVIPQAAERTTYVVATVAVLALLFWLWQPIGGTLWQLAGPARVAVLGLYAAGWAVAFWATFLISHFDLFGVRQAWLAARGREYRPPAFSERGLYRYVRHPLMSGFLILVWAAPTMTAGHLVFAAAATGYIFVGTRFEEHDLADQLGDSYRAYSARVPAVCPVPRRHYARESEG